MTHLDNWEDLIERPSDPRSFMLLAPLLAPLAATLRQFEFDLFTTFAVCFLATAVIHIGSNALRIARRGRLSAALRSRYQQSLDLNEVNALRQLRVHETLIRMRRAWAQPTVDAMYYNAEILLLLERGQELRRKEDVFVPFVLESFDKMRGLFGSRPRATGTPFDTLCALGVLKSLYGIRCSTPLGLQRAAEILGWRDADRVAASAVDLAGRIVNGTTRGHGHTVIDLYTCWGVAWNLQHDADALEQCQGLGAYFNALVVRDKNGTTIRLSPESRLSPDDEPCLSAAYFALKLAKYARIDLPQDAYEGVAHFLEGCRALGGGFGATPGAPPNVLHTRMGLELCELLRRPVPTLRDQKAFTERCRTPAGYAFAPHLTPNAYATRCAIQILYRHADQHPSQRPLCDTPRFAGLADVILERFFDPDTGRAVGVPIG